MRVMIGVAGAVVALLAGCADRPPVAASAPVSDPYVDTGDGGAVYARDLNAGGVATVRVLPGTPTAAEFRGLAGDTVTFALGDATLSPEARAIVAQQAAWLAKNAAFVAVIEGHADDPGGTEVNLALAARRAAAVQDLLIVRGVEPARITTTAFGRERPLEACTTEDCFARNRRAVTIVSPGAAI